MDEREPFLKRWSRLKGGGIPPAPGDAEALAPSADGAETDAVVSSVQQSDEPFDLAELPRVDELTADSDIRRFLDARGARFEQRELGAARHQQVHDLFVPVIHGGEHRAPGVAARVDERGRRRDHRFHPFELAGLYRIEEFRRVWG